MEHQHTIVRRVLYYTIIARGIHRGEVSELCGILTSHLSLHSAQAGVALKFDDPQTDKN